MVGLALANSVATALEMAGLIVLMRRRLNGLEGREILTGVGQAGLAAVIMSLVLWVWSAQTIGQTAWLVGGAGVVLGGGVYAGAIGILGVREMRGVGRALAAQWRRLAP